MKRKLLFFPVLAVVMLAVTASVTAAPYSAAEAGYYRGDANKDGKVDIRDVTEIQRYLMKLATPSFDVKAADVDNNGLKINDATLIQRYLSDFSNPYKIGTFVKEAEVSPSDPYELPFIPIR